jgi:hypothetical protein
MHAAEANPSAGLYPVNSFKRLFKAGRFKGGRILTQAKETMK